MGHFLRLLFTRRWGWALIGALIIAGGVLWGVSSPIIPYESTPLNTTYFVGAVSNGDVYVWTTDPKNPTFYVARHEDFSSPISSASVTLKGYVSFVARADTIYVNQNLTDHLHATQAHIIEQLTLYDSNEHPINTYEANGYTPNSTGYFDNRWWPGGSATIAAGLLVACVALFVRRKKRATAPAAAQNDPNWPFSAIPAYPTADPAAQANNQPPTP